MGFSPFGGFGGIMFGIVPVIVIIGFIFVFGTIIVRSIQGAKEWKRNNETPVLTVDATVVTKRADVHQYHHNAGTDTIHHMSSSTTYYATFEVTSGDRLEFKIRDIEYGMLVENDMGRLTFQGTRYLGFERNRS
jgi:fatty acid desaturase